MSTRVFKQVPSTLDEDVIGLFDSSKPWRACRLQKENADSNPPAILVIDDDHAILSLMKVYLQKAGFYVHTAASGIEAVGLYQNKRLRPAAILLDVKMAPLDGPQTFERIREFDQLVPICFMTGDPGKYQTHDLFAFGASHLFAKPLSLAKVAQILHQFIDPSVYGEVASRLTSWSPTKLVTSPFQFADASS